MDYLQFSECVTLVEKKLKIDEVVARYANLRKTGEYYRCRCPIHDDDGESLIVNPDTGIFYCSGCHAGGNVLKFLAMAEKISLFDVIEQQAKILNVDLYHRKADFDEVKFEAKKREVAEIYEYARDFYHEILTDSAEGAVCRKYLESRGISKLAVEKFNIGFVSKADKKLTRFLYEYNFNVRMILNSGLISHKEQFFDDKFQDCIVFPISDPANKLSTLIGRVFDFDKKSFYESEGLTSKYIYPDETAVFNREKLIFGLNAAKKSCQKEGTVIIVEDCLDAVILSNVGIENIVAIPQNNLDFGIAKSLTKYAKRIVFCLKNGDKLQIKEVILKIIANDAGNILVAALPKNPAEYLEEKGKEELLKHIEHPLKFEEYEFSKRILSQKAESTEVNTPMSLTPRHNLAAFIKRSKYMGVVLLKLAYRDADFLKYVSQIVFPEMFEYEPHQEIFRYLKICIDEDVLPNKEDARDYLEPESYKEFLKILEDPEVIDEIKETPQEAEIYLHFVDDNSMRKAAEDVLETLLDQRSRFEYGIVRDKDIKSYNEFYEKLNNLQVIKSEEGY